MPNPKTRSERRAQQAAEVEASQADLRHSIAVTERLVGESERMLLRHREECDADDLHQQHPSRREALPGA